MRRFLVPVGCALVQSLSVVPGLPADRSEAASAAASLAGLASGLLLLRRHSAPLHVLGGTVVGYLAQALLIGAVVPLVVVVAAYGAARRALLGPDGRPQRGVALVLAGAAVAVAAAPSLTGGGDLAAPYVVVLLLAALAGLLLAQRAGRDASERRELVQTERLRLSRDLHDVVGHGLSAITVQAGAARLAVTAGDHSAAVRALAEIEDAGRAVLREVRWLVTLLRDDGERPRLTEVLELVEGARRSGLEVSLDTRGDLADVSDDVGETAYRLVQEALTNVLRHAPDARAAVTVEVADDLCVAVVDDGPPAGPDVAEGNGIRGMRERAAALAGTVEAGPRPEGWSVACRLPLRVRAR